jgi:hypothetical protein
MRSIKTKKEYQVFCTCIEELPLAVGNDTLTDNTSFIDLDLL